MDLDETVHYEPSHLDLHYLHRYLYPFTGLKELTPYHVCPKFEQFVYLLRCKTLLDGGKQFYF